MTLPKTKEMISRLICKEFALHGITVKMLILFGSQARSGARPDSDWDFLVVADRNISWSEKREIWHSLSLVLAKEHVSADVLIKSEEEFARDRNDKGKVTYYAQKDGMVI
jgi:predicted nucleotidyltransferase